MHKSAHYYLNHHGIAGFLANDTKQLQTTLTTTNSSDEPAAFANSIKDTAQTSPYTHETHKKSLMKEKMDDTVPLPGR
jgi:hypothetical protein